MANINFSSSVQKAVAKKSNLSKRNTLPPPSPQHHLRPLPRRLVPFRHPDFTDDQIQRLTEGSQVTKERLLKNLRKLNTSASTDHSVESVVGATVPETNSQNEGDPVGGVSSGATSPVGTGAGGEGELLSAVISRLVWLETKLSEAHNQLQDKEKMVTELEDQIAIMEISRDAYKDTKIGQLEDTCLQLQYKVHQMERFLGDCGLVWVGDGRASFDSSSSLNVAKDAGDASNEVTTKTIENKDLEIPSVRTLDDSFKIDYDLMIENIRDLNVLAGEGIPQICLSSDAARLKLIDHVPLTLYSNGIFLCGGPFRPFVDNDTRQCVRDLMDGYFPSELQRRYPNGVPLKVIDKRTIEFKERPSNISRSVAGLSMKTLPLPVSRSPSLSPVSPTSSSASPLGSSPDISLSSTVPHISVQQLFESLPRSTVRDGRLVDVRNSIIQLLKGSVHSFDLVVIDTPVLKDGRTSMRPVTTLRIRSETGNETYLMKLYTTDTIGDVRKHLDSHRTSHSTDYDIVALYPRRVFCRPNETLEKCDLVPNAALYLHHVVTQGGQLSTS